MQSDLFNLSVSNSFERQAFERSFFEKKHTLRTDQILGFGLMTIVFFVLVFAWGVEHGKAVSRRDMLHNHTALANAADQMVQTAAPAESKIIQTEMVSPAVEVTTETAIPLTVSSPVTASVLPSTTTVSARSKYTIAHITYVKKDQALSEIARIKSKGYSAFMIPSGRFYQICVNGFESRKLANDSIRNLRLKGIVSADSYIRNIPAAR